MLRLQHITQSWGNWKHSEGPFVINKSSVSQIKELINAGSADDFLILLFLVS